ncbi:MAG: Lrp/AsnC family transcriptional regulator [Candidatus Heimdallarchaeota archaeon]|nr:Lrp/AsnC family transcriptional regulator [Candidatus Heimdallarchaeota archaeon]
MSEMSVRTRSALSKKFLFYGLALTSAVLSASYVVVDTYVSALLDDSMILAQLSWMAGALIIGSLMLVLAIPLRRINGIRIPLGTHLDPNFRPFFLPPWAVLKWVTLSGVFMSISTMLYFQLLQEFDASIMAPLMSFTIIYLLIGDFVLEKDNPTMIEIQGIIAIVAGIFISSLSRGEFDAKAVFLALVVMNGMSALITIFNKKATQWVDLSTRQPLDAITFRFYAVVTTLIINSILFIILADPQQHLGLWRVGRTVFWTIILSMFLATLSYIFIIRALRMGKMSIINSLSSFSVILSIPLTMIGHFVLPDAIPFDLGGSNGIILKSIGAVLVITGMLGLALSEVRVLAIAKVTEDGLKQINHIASLKGVTRVSVLAGKYDLLITIRTRSIGKGYRQTIRKIRGIPTVQYLETITIMKEWGS